MPEDWAMHAWQCQSVVAPGKAEPMSQTKVISSIEIMQGEFFGGPRILV